MPLTSPAPSSPSSTADTLEVLNGHHADHIRLNGIDCPEKGQAFSKQDEHAAAALAFGKEVIVQTHSHDKYNRTIGEVILPDGMNLNQELVRKGWRWWYRKHVSWNTVLEGLEPEAREGRKGLWADPQPVLPWVLQKARVPTR